MTSPYRQLLRVPGGWQFSLAGFFGRLPLSMAGIALLLLMVDITGSYFTSGAVVATWVLTGAAVAPTMGKLTDRLGQSRVIGPQIAVNLLAVSSILLLAALAWPLWCFFVAAAAAGGSTPVIGSVVRARWSALLPDSVLLRTAFSWESVVDEFVFVVGPPLAALTSEAAGAPQAVALAALLGASGTVALLSQRRTEPPARGRAERGAQWVLRYSGMPSLMVVMAALGLLFAGVEVTVIATARESGATWAGGLVLALWSVSSMVTGLVIGGLRRAPALYRQLLVGNAVMACLLLPLVVSQGLLMTSIILFIAGGAVSPTLIAGFTLVERIVPGARLNEALNWASTALSVGFALGSPTSGWLVDTVDVGAGYWVGIASATAALIATVVARPALSGRELPVSR